VKEHSPRSPGTGRAALLTAGTAGLTRLFSVAMKAKP
jgi:hypothetical protein